MTRALRWLDWAQLMKRYWATDVLVCPRCRGPMRIVTVVEDPRTKRARTSVALAWQSNVRAPLHRGQFEISVGNWVKEHNSSDGVGTHRRGASVGSLSATAALDHAAAEHSNRQPAAPGHLLNAMMRRSLGAKEVPFHEHLET